MHTFGLSLWDHRLPRGPPVIEPSFRVDRCEIAGGRGVTENGSYSLAVDDEYGRWKCPGVLDSRVGLRVGRSSSLGAEGFWLAASQGCRARSKYPRASPIPTCPMMHPKHAPAGAWLTCESPRLMTVESLFPTNKVLNLRLV